MNSVVSQRAAQTLTKAVPLALNPDAPIAIKRDVHEFEVDADADVFAAAFRALVTDPATRFGLIQIKRPEDRLGHAFVIGERFQGCFSVERGVLGIVERTRLAALAPAIRRLLATRTGRAIASWIEDRMLSDYAEIEDIEDGGPGRAHRLRYRYLDGTPIAGSSVFVVEPIGPGRCRVVQVFEYQEVNGIALGTFQRFGLKYHDQVVHMQIHQAAARVGATATGTIPTEYAEL